MINKIYLLLKGRTLTATFTEAMADNNMMAWTSYCTDKRSLRRACMVIYY